MGLSDSVDDSGTSAGCDIFRQFGYMITCMPVSSKPTILCGSNGGESRLDFPSPWSLPLCPCTVQTTQSGPRKLAILNTFAAVTAHLLVSKQANLYLGDAEC